MGLKLQCIDHVHVEVANREVSAKWYEDTLSLSPVKKFAMWADNNGPLLIANEQHSLHLALFERQVQSSRASIAFAADGESWLRWIDELQAKQLPVRLANHDLAFSLYFSDPDGNELEITTYDVEMGFPD